MPKRKPRTETRTDSSRGIAKESAPEYESQIRLRRVSFVVRLVLDEHGQFERTEIEHVSSGGKQNFQNLDGYRLVAFMKKYIPTSFEPKDIVSTTLPSGDQ